MSRATPATPTTRDEWEDVGFVAPALRGAADDDLLALFAPATTDATDPPPDPAPAVVAAHLDAVRAARDGAGPPAAASSLERRLADALADALKVASEALTMVKTLQAKLAEVRAAAPPPAAPAAGAHPAPTPAAATHTPPPTLADGGFAPQPAFEAHLLRQLAQRAKTGVGAWDMRGVLATGWPVAVPAASRVAWLKANPKFDVVGDILIRAGDRVALQSLAKSAGTGGPADEAAAARALDARPAILRHIMYYVGASANGGVRSVATTIAKPFWPATLPPPRRAAALRGHAAFVVKGDTIKLADVAATNAALAAAGVALVPTTRKADADTAAADARAAARLAARPAFVRELVRIVGHRGACPVADVIQHTWPGNLRGCEAAALRGCAAFSVDAAGVVRLA